MEKDGIVAIEDLCVASGLLTVRRWSGEERDNLPMRRRRFVSRFVCASAVCVFALVRFVFNPCQRARTKVASCQICVKLRRFGDIRYSHLRLIVLNISYRRCRSSSKNNLSRVGAIPACSKETSEPSTHHSTQKSKR
jgi:hypothetical protein